MSSGKPVKESSKIISLNPIFKDLIRMGGLIRHGNVPENIKHQTVFAKYHVLSLLVIHYIREEHIHVGRKHALVLLRQR